jgi:hypothetical protein
MTSAMNDRAINISKYDAVLLPDGSYLNMNGSIHWFDEAGRFHNEQGPSIIHLSNLSSMHLLPVQWHLHGVRLSLKLWLLRSTISDEEKMLLRLQYA